MHTETDYTRTEAFIARYRAEIALTVGALLAVALIVAWAVLAPLLLHIQSDNMGMAVSVLSVFGGAIAALAFYWGAE
jgi:hypothetical protein